MADHLSPNSSSVPDVYAEIGMSLTKNFRNQSQIHDEFDTLNQTSSNEQLDDPLWSGGERLSTDNLASMFDLIHARLQTATTNDDEIMDARPSYTSSPVINRVRSNESIMSDITTDAALNSPLIPTAAIIETTSVSSSSARAVSTERYSNNLNNNRTNPSTVKSPVVAAALEGVQIGGNNRFKSPAKSTTANSSSSNNNRASSPDKKILKTISKPSDVKELLATLRSRSPPNSNKLNSSSSTGGGILGSYSTTGADGRYKSPTTGVRSSGASAPRSSVVSSLRSSTNTNTTANSRNTTPTTTVKRGSTSTSTSRSGSTTKATTNRSNPTIATTNPRAQTPTSRIRALLQSPAPSTVSPSRRTKSPSVREIVRGTPGSRYNSMPVTATARTPTTPSRTTTSSKATTTPNSVSKRSTSAPGGTNREGGVGSSSSRPTTPNSSINSSIGNRGRATTPTSTAKSGFGSTNNRSTTPTGAGTTRSGSTVNNSRSTTPTNTARGGLGSTNSRPATPTATKSGFGSTNSRSTTPTGTTRGGFGSTNSRPTTPNGAAARSVTPNASSKLKLSSSSSMNPNTTPSRSTTPNKGIIKTRSSNSPGTLSAPSPTAIRSTTPNNGIIKTRSAANGMSSTPSNTTPVAGSKTPSRSTTPTLNSSGNLSSSRQNNSTPSQGKRPSTPTGTGRATTPNSNRGTVNRTPLGGNSNNGNTPASRLSALVSRSGSIANSRVSGSGISGTNRPPSASKRTTSPSTVSRMPSSSSSSTAGSVSNASNNKLKNVITNVQSTDVHPWGGPSRKQETQKAAMMTPIPSAASPSSTSNAPDDDEVALLDLPSTMPNRMGNEPKDHTVALSNDEVINEIFTTSRSASRNTGVFDEAMGASEPGNLNDEFDADFERNNSGKIEGIARSPQSNEECDVNNAIRSPSRGNKPPISTNRTASPSVSSAKITTPSTRRPSSGKFSFPETSLSSGSNKMSGSIRSSTPDRKSSASGNIRSRSSTPDRKNSAAGNIRSRSSTPDRRNSATENTPAVGVSAKRRGSASSVVQSPSEEELLITQQLIKHVKSNFKPLPLSPEIPKIYMPSLTHSSQSAINAIYKIAKISAFATKSLIESNNQTQRMKSPERLHPGSVSSNGFNSIGSGGNSVATKSLRGLASLSTNSMGNTTIATNTTDGGNSNNHVSMTSPLTASWEELNRMTQIEWTADSPVTKADSPPQHRPLKSHSSIARINSNSSMLAEDDDNSSVTSATFANIKAKIMKRSNSMVQYEEEMENAAADDTVSVLTADSSSTAALNATNTTPFASVTVATTTNTSYSRAGSTSTAIRSSTSLNQLNYPSPPVQIQSLATINNVVLPPTTMNTPFAGSVNSAAGSRPSSGVYTISPTTPVISSGLISPSTPAINNPPTSSVTSGVAVNNSGSSTQRGAPPTPSQPKNLTINTTLRTPSMYGNLTDSPASTGSPILKSSPSSLGSSSPPSTNYHRPGPTAAYGVPVPPPSTTSSSNTNNHSNSNGILSVSSLNSTANSPSKYRPYGSVTNNASTATGSTGNAYNSNFSGNYASPTPSPGHNGGNASSTSASIGGNNSVSGESPNRSRPSSGSFAYPPVVANSLMQSRGIPAAPTSSTPYYLQQQQRYNSPSATSPVPNKTGVNNFSSYGGSSSSSSGNNNRFSSPYNNGGNTVPAGMNATPSTSGYGYGSVGGSNSAPMRYTSPAVGGGNNGLPPLHSPSKSYSPAY